MSTLKERNAQRMRMSIAGERPDAHAVFNFYTYPFYHAVTKVNLDEFFHNPKVMFDTQLESFELLNGCGNFAPDVGVVAETSALGGKVGFDRHGFIVVEPAEIDDIDDVLAIKPGDPYGDNYMRHALESLEYMVQNCPKGYKVNPSFLMGPFTIGAQLRGISDFCADTIAEPELVHALLNVIVETQVNFLKAQEKILGAPLHHVLVCDDLSAFLSRPAYQEFVLPYYHKLFAEFPNTQRWLHNDSTARHIAPDVPNAEMVAWQYLPDIEPQDALALTDNKVSLLGGLNPVELASLSVEETIIKCNQVIDSFQGNPRCVLAAGGSINAVPLDNLRAMFQVADQRKI